MSKRAAKTLALWLLLVSVGNSGWAAEYLRCGGNLVTKGDRKLDVLAKCGEPDLKEDRVQERTRRVFDPTRGIFREFSGTVYVDEWTYNFGPQRFYYVVTFVDGVVQDISSPGYGY